MSHLDQRPVFLPTGHYVIPGHCWTQAHYNKAHVYHGLELKVVCGSLGIGKVQPWYEYGGADNKIVKDFKFPLATTASEWDAHVWLEGPDGKVFDIFTKYMGWVAGQHGKIVDYPVDVHTAIDAVDKPQLRLRGLHYIPAPDMVQSIILEKMRRDFSGYLAQFP